MTAGKCATPVGNSANDSGWALCEQGMGKVDGRFCGEN